MKILKRFAPWLLAFTIVFGSCMTVSASDSSVFDIIDMGEIPSSYSYFIGWYSESSGEYTYLFTRDKMQVVVNNSSYTFKSPTSVYADFYIRRPSDGVWMHNIYNGGDSAQFTWTVGLTTPIITNYEVCDISTGKVVFPTPPTLMIPTIQRVEELPKIVENQAVILIPTVVFCLALLASLVMLRRKLPVFLRL